MIPSRTIESRTTDAARPGVRSAVAASRPRARFATFVAGALALVVAAPLIASEAAATGVWARSTAGDGVSGDPCRLPADSFRTLVERQDLERTAALPRQASDLFGIETRPIVTASGEAAGAWPPPSTALDPATDGPFLRVPDVDHGEPSPGLAPAPRWIVWSDPALRAALANRQTRSSAQASASAADPTVAPAADGPDPTPAAGDAPTETAVAPGPGDEAPDEIRDPSEPASERDDIALDNAGTAVRAGGAHWRSRPPTEWWHDAADVLRLDRSVNALLLADGLALPAEALVAKRDTTSAPAGTAATRAMADCLAALAREAATAGRGLWAVPASPDSALERALEPREARQELRAWMPVTGVVTGARSQRRGWQWQLDNLIWIDAPGPLEAFDPVAAEAPETDTQRPPNNIRQGDRVYTIARLTVQRGMRVLTPHPLAAIHRIDPPPAE